MASDKLLPDGVAARKRVRDPFVYPERFKREDAAKLHRDRSAQAQAHPFVRKHYGC